mmetsp:Transcript_6432/g.12856  ORF Transcript_6432/g.12856 Transcript_6432/m.12856 type:complete len:82 (+) Transcript_6432:967-1212(+)
MENIADVNVDVRSRLLSTRLNMTYSYAKSGGRQSPHDVAILFIHSLGRSCWVWRSFQEYFSVACVESFAPSLRGTLESRVP